MNRTSALAQRYGAVLQMYVSTGGEEALEEAQDIGREALESGIGPLVLFSMHRDVVQQLPPQPVEGDEFVSRITTVFIETLAPFQMSAGSFDQAQAQLTELGTIMHRHKQELDALKRQPGQEEGPQIRELEAMIERHSGEIEEVRARLGNTGRSPGTSRRMVADIVHIQEEERRRLVGEIHDDAVQAMTAVLLRIGLLGTKLEKPDQVQLAHELENNVRDAIARLRRLLIGLSPPELNRGGLGSAVVQHWSSSKRSSRSTTASTTDSSPSLTRSRGQSRSASFRRRSPTHASTPVRHTSRSSSSRMPAACVSA